MSEHATHIGQSKPWQEGDNFRASLEEIQSLSMEDIQRTHIEVYNVLVAGVMPEDMIDTFQRMFIMSSIMLMKIEMVMEREKETHGPSQRQLRRQLRKKK